MVGPVVDPETGLIYELNRYYDPTTGQFLSRDPLVAITGSAYGYVNDNPLNGTDPMGLFCLLGHVHGSHGPCRGTNVSTDLKVAAAVAGGTALLIATGGAAAPALLEGVGLTAELAAGVTTGLGVASTALSAGAAGIDCPGHWDGIRCWSDIASVIGGVSTSVGGLLGGVLSSGNIVAGGFTIPAEVGKGLSVLVTALGFEFDLTSFAKSQTSSPCPH